MIIPMTSHQLTSINTQCDTIIDILHDIRREAGYHARGTGPHWLLSLEVAVSHMKLELRRASAAVAAESDQRVYASEASLQLNEENMGS